MAGLTVIDDWQVGAAGFAAADAAFSSTLCAPVADAPVIDLLSGGLHQAVSATIDILRAAGVEIYDRGGMLYRPVTIESPERGDGITRRVGATVLRPVTTAWLANVMSATTKCRRYDVRSNTWRIVDPDPRIASTIVDAPDLGAWPVLRAVIQAPVVTLDGRVIARAGFDAETGLLARWDGEWPLNDNPSRDDAAEAVLRLRTLHRHFPWVTPTDRAVHLSYIVSALMRPVMIACPLHAIDSTEPGSGKSLTVDGGAVLATGAPASVCDWGDDAAEATKRLDAMILAGDSIIAIDNVERPLDGPVICQILTQPSRRIRPLGGSVMVSAPCTALVTATGVNLVLRGDIVRRAIVCRLDAGVERPELRTIDQDYLAEVRARRRELVADVITIVRAYHLAGCPDVGLGPLGGYAEWCRMVRQPLVWAGEADPCATMARLRDDDPSRASGRAVYGAWHAAVGDTAMTCAEMIARARDDDDLRAALEQVALRRGHLDARALGWWCRSHRDRRSAGLSLIVDGQTREGVQRWSVRGTSTP